MEKSLRALMLLLTERHALAARLSWPVFSFASYTIVAGLARQRIDPRTVIDVGANVGQFAVAAAMHFPQARILAMEPLPDCLPVLRRNTRKLPNVTVYPCALGEADGDASFHVNSHPHSSSMLPLAAAHRAAFPDAKETTTISVQVRALDSLLAGAELQAPVLLKLDVQGFEARVLRGASELLRRVEYLLMEVSFKPLYEDELPFTDMLPLVQGFGFRFLRPLDWLSEPATGEILQMDALFGRA